MKIIKKSVPSCIAILLLLPQLLHAANIIPCYIQFVKDTCWKDYTVSLQVKDGMTNESLSATTVLPPHKFDALQSFNCKPNQQITVTGSFSPPIWKEAEVSTYHIKKFWNVPSALPPKTDKWVVTVCFSKDFVAVPVPPVGNGDCRCHYPPSDLKNFNQNIN